MRLKDYLKLKNISHIQFSKVLEISPVSLSRYINGERFPEKKTLVKIYNETGGFVSPNDFCFRDEKEYFIDEDEQKKIKKIHNHIQSGSRKYLGKAITLIESSLKKDQIISERLLEQFKGNNKSIRIGITGAVLVNQLLLNLSA